MGSVLYLLFYDEFVEHVWILIMTVLAFVFALGYTYVVPLQVKSSAAGATTAETRQKPRIVFGLRAGSGILFLGLYVFYLLYVLKP